MKVRLEPTLNSVERAGNPEDKRGLSLSLSTAGRKQVPLLADLADENDAAFFAILTPSAQDRLRDALRALIDKHQLSAVPVD